MRRSILPILGLVSLSAVRPAFVWSQVLIGPEFQVNSYTTNRQDRPSVAVDADGNFVVVWTSDAQDGNGAGVFAQRYDASGALAGGEFRVNSYTTGIQESPAVASAANGTFVVVWKSLGQDGSDAGVFGQRYDASAAPQGAEFQVNSYTTSAQAGSGRIRSWPAVASDADGNFVVVWDSLDQDGSSNGVFGQRYDSSGTLQGAEFRVNSYTTGSQGFAAVASAPNGEVIVVWSGAGSDGTGIYGRRYNGSGAAQGDEFRVDSNTTLGGYPAVASDAAGNFVVAWEGYNDGSINGVFGRRYDASGTPRAGEFRVNTFTTHQQIYPFIAADAAGGFTVVWMSIFQDGFGSGVYGQSYDAAGAPRGGEFRVNSTVVNEQALPAISADPNGNFVVVWQSGGQDGSSYGVFGQRYEADLIFKDDFEAGTPGAAGTLYGAEFESGRGTCIGP